MMTVASLSGVQGARLEGEVEPAVVRRGEPVVIRLTTTGRLPGDRVDHYMIWTSGRPVPNPLRIEGSNYILADGSKDGVFPLEVSQWEDGAYVIHARSYYYAAPGAPLQRLDDTLPLHVHGGPLPPRLTVTPATTTITTGDGLRLRVDVQRAGRLGRPQHLSLVSLGQQVRLDESPALDRSEFPVADLSPGRVSVPTEGWRPQVLRCLAVRAHFPKTSGRPALTLIARLPPLTIEPQSGARDPRVLPSYRGSRPIHLLTVGPGMHTFPYPTCQSWRKGSRYVFCETDGPRPDGRRIEGERQLMMVEVATGRQVHLATLGVENTAGYGRFHRATSSQYHSDYAPGADLLVYYDMTGHNLYTLHPGGKPVRVLHESNATIGDPPAIARDGSRLCYYVIAPGPTPSRYFTGTTSMIFVLDLDPRTGEARGKPKMVLAYPWRKTPFRDGPVDWRSTISCNHVQLCPTDPDRVGYAHEGGYPRTGEPENTRVWTIRADGTDNRPVAPEHEKGTYYTHEVLGPLGRYEYVVWGGSVARLTPATGAFECVYKATGVLRAGHIAVSPDENWIAADIMGGLGEDDSGNPVGGVFLIETATGNATFLVAFPCGRSHPRHPHPNFSPDGTKVGFTVASGRSGSQIAYVDVTDIVRQPAPGGTPGG